jgi:hypothetical protein
MLMAALPTDLHLYSEAADLVQHAQWCLWADPLTQSEQVRERPRRRVEQVADSVRVTHRPNASGSGARIIRSRAPIGAPSR